MSPTNRDRPFADLICERMGRFETRVLVGIDPVLSRFPEELRGLEPERALVRFSTGVLDAVADVAAGVKFQIAFFERHGWRGWRALTECVAAASSRGIPVVLDAKRGDIGSTAEAYADALLGDDPDTPGPSVDALTVNPYLGMESMAPFIARARDGNRGLFILARTSNPGGDEFQDRLADDAPLYLRVARAVEAQNATLGTGANGYGPLGLVVGATRPQQLVEVREAAPSSLILLPGIGAQGGAVRDVLSAFDERHLGGLVAASRSVIYAEPAESESWQDAVARAGRELRQEIEGGLVAAR